MSDAPAIRMSRRAVLAGMAAVSGCAAFGLAGGAFAAGELALQELAPDVFLITGAGCNILAARGPEGIVLVDSGAAEQAGALAEFIAANFGGAPVSRLINTHWHLENTGGNDMFGAAGVPILAHKNTQLWMGAEFGVDWQQRRYAPRASEAMPAEAFYDGGSIGAGAETLEYDYMLQGHTDGDIYVHLPNANVLMAGGVVAQPGRYPIMDYSTGGWIGGMLDGLLTMIELSDDSTRVLGEQGPVLTRADMQAQYDMLLAMKAKFIELMMEGLGPDDMLAAGATAEYDAVWGDPALFVHQSYQGMLGHLRVLGGIIA